MKVLQLQEVSLCRLERVVQVKLQLLSLFIVEGEGKEYQSFLVQLDLYRVGYVKKNVDAYASLFIIGQVGQVVRVLLCIGENVWTQEALSVCFVEVEEVELLHKIVHVLSSYTLDSNTGVVEKYHVFSYNVFLVELSLAELVSLSV